MAAPIPDDDRERVHQLLEDMTAILESPNFPRPSPATIRTVFAPVLRRWIVERNFFSAQKLLRPQEIKFEVAINGNAAKLCKLGYYEHWMAIIMSEKSGLAFHSSHRNSWEADHSR